MLLWCMLENPLVDLVVGSAKGSGECFSTASWAGEAEDTPEADLDKALPWRLDQGTSKIHDNVCAGLLYGPK